MGSAETKATPRHAGKEKKAELHPSIQLNNLNDFPLSFRLLPSERLPGRSGVMTIQVCAFWKSYIRSINTHTRISSGNAMERRGQ